MRLRVAIPLALPLALIACPQTVTKETPVTETVVTETLFSCGSSKTVKTCTFRASTDDLLELVDIPADLIVKSVPIPTGLPVTWSLNGVERKIQRVIINLVITDAKSVVLDKFPKPLRLRIAPAAAVLPVRNPYTLLKWTGQLWKPIPKYDGQNVLGLEYSINNWGDPPIAWGD
jgi:hypothetical protein